MGSPESEAERTPFEMQHQIRISRPFLMGAYEVTQDQYQKIMGTNPSEFIPGKSGASSGRSSNFPVDNMLWYDAVRFCNGLSKNQGLPLCFSNIEGNPDFRNDERLKCDWNANGFRVVRNK
ncbi:MAG: SUMF1/EgtB/PvdO family nonheme iron enzyme [Candidatus Ozemobacteraceae bacterium]